MALVLVTPPETEPVTVAELGAFLRITDAGEIATLSSYIAPAREMIEAQTGLALIAQDWKYLDSRFPNCEHAIELERTPLSEVTSVKYYDANNTLQTLSTSLYHVVTYKAPGGITLAKDQEWPETYERPDAVQIEFTAGYGDTGADVPHRAKTVTLQLAAWLYNHRDLAESVKYEELPHHYQAMVASLKVGGWAA